MINTTDYRLAPSGEGPQADTWKDKPHRLIYDLCSEIDRLRGESEPKKAVVMNDDELRVYLMNHTRKDLDWRSWTTTVHCSDGAICLGKGLTHKQAIDDAVVKFREYEAFLALSPEDQLREIMKKDRILDTDKERCIRLLTELVLGDRE